MYGSVGGLSWFTGECSSSCTESSNSVSGVSAGI